MSHNSRCVTDNWCANCVTDNWCADNFDEINFSFVVFCCRLTAIAGRLLRGLIVRPAYTVLMHLSHHLIVLISTHIFPCTMIIQQYEFQSVISHVPCKFYNSALLSMSVNTLHHFENLHSWRHLANINEILQKYCQWMSNEMWKILWLQVYRVLKYTLGGITFLKAPRRNV